VKYKLHFTYNTFVTLSFPRIRLIVGKVQVCVHTKYRCHSVVKLFIFCVSGFGEHMPEYRELIFYSSVVNSVQVLTSDTTL